MAKQNLTIVGELAKLNEVPGYRSWSMMKQRCNNPNYTHYSYYGGRGIKVCERWNDFRNFYEDMGARPSPQHSLDRIDNDGNYEPDNCRWATKLEQVLNRGINSNNTSGHKGVSRRGSKWRAYVMVDHKQINLGTYTSFDEAVIARERYEDTR